MKGLASNLITTTRLRLARPPDRGPEIRTSSRSCPQTNSHGQSEINTVLMSVLVHQVLANPIKNICNVSGGQIAPPVPQKDKICHLKRWPELSTLVMYHNLALLQVKWRRKCKFP